MEFVVVLETDETTGNVVADVPQLPGCHTEGRTRSEALENVREAIELYLSVKGPSSTVSVTTVTIEA